MQSYQKKKNILQKSVQTVYLTQVENTLNSFKALDLAKKKLNGFAHKNVSFGEWFFLVAKLLYNSLCPPVSLQRYGKNAIAIY